MIATTVFNTEAKAIWDGVSGRVSNKGLENLATLLAPQIEAGDVAKIEDPNKTGVFEGLGWRLEVHALGGKSALFRSYVLTCPANFAAQMETEIGKIEGVLVNDRS
jgi:hypothetical protein